MGRDRMRRTNTRILCAMGVSAIALMAAPALAQEAVETAPADAPEATEQGVSEVGEIVVTGFRSSLQQALGMKRREAGAVEPLRSRRQGAGQQGLSEPPQPEAKTRRAAPSCGPSHFVLAPLGTPRRGPPFSSSRRRVSALGAALSCTEYGVGGACVNRWPDFPRPGVGRVFQRPQPPYHRRNATDRRSPDPLHAAGP